MACPGAADIHLLQKIRQILSSTLVHKKKLKRTEYVVGATCPVGYIIRNEIDYDYLPEAVGASSRSDCTYRAMLLGGDYYLYFRLPGQSSVPRSDRRFTAWFTRFRGLKPP